ncbi:Ulp1 protease family, C-terminal catalytic domain [Sesbania bispinosa]|nr:Ulp1 protease family, C-terminal catalytic domain [Sesbania bispinosa]
MGGYEIVIAKISHEGSEQHEEELHVEDNTETKLNNVHTLANTVSGLASSVDQMTEIMKKMVDRLDMLDKSYQDVKKRQSQLESSMASDFTEREDKPVELSNSNLTPIIDLTDDGEMGIIYDYVNKKNSPATPNNYHISPKDSTSHKKEIYVKKLSFNGSPDRMELKIPKTEPQTKHTPTKRTVDEMMMSAGNKSAVRVDQTSKTADGITIPSFIRSNFKPTEEMHLTPIQAQVSVYVFHENNLPSEIIFKIDETQGSREDFDTLRPDRGISPQIIKFVALKATYIHRKSCSQTFWMLPPNFARDVFRGYEVDQLLRKYKDKWLPTYSELHYIYVPMQNVSDQWFLMVVSIEDKVIYHFDSFLPDRCVHPRRHTMMKVCKALSEVIRAGVFPCKCFKNLQDLENWEVTEPIGMPVVPYGENSAVYVLYWMHMMHAFNPNIGGGEVNETNVRMRAAMNLLCGDHNACWSSLQFKAEAFWRIVRFPPKGHC